MTHRIGIEGSELGFDCAPGQSLLDAALRAGIELPYSCRKGACGSCAGVVAAGSVAGLDGAPTRNEYCAPGQVLYCQCTALSDVVLRPASWRRAEPGARKRLTAKVYRNQLAAPDVSVLQLRLPAGQRARFQAGQYLQLRLDDGSVRCYSMANPPHENDGVVLHVRHVAGGRFSAQVARLAPGDLLEIELPFGSVALPDDGRPLVLVAGGTGFAPVKSLLDEMARRRVQRPLTLIWGARDAAGLYLLPAIDKWRRQWPEFRFVAALSGAQPAVDGPPALAGAFAGRTDAALRATCPDLAGQVLHCCGSPAMVAAVRSAALDCGLAPADFHADVFVPGPAAPASGAD